MKIEKVVDENIRRILRERLAFYDGDTKKAFANLAEDPIYLNREKGITVRTVRIRTGLSAVEPVRKNERGVAIGFVKPGNNHHVAIYSNSEGRLIEHVCTFWHAVERFKQIKQVLITNSTQVWTTLNESGEEYDELFLDNLPIDGLLLKLSMQQNEMFLLGLNNEQIDDAIQSSDYGTLSKYLYRVQKLSSCNYMFRHHLEPLLDDSKDSANAKRYYSIRSIKSLLDLNPVKVKINNIGIPHVEIV